MKNTLVIFAVALLFSVSAKAQSTVDSIASKYQLLPMPAPLTIEKTFPVLGTYQLSEGEEVKTVLVTLDESNKGIIWVEGLPQGRVKAYLKQSPATYRIIAQKTESGKQVPEGTPILDPETRNLNIALGKSYNAADPAAVFSLNAAASQPGTAEVKVKTKGSSKQKSKLIFYTASRIEQMPAQDAGTASPAPAPLQQ